MTYELRCPWCGYLIGKATGSGYIQMPCPRRRCSGPTVVTVAYGEAASFQMTSATPQSRGYLTVTQM